MNETAISPAESPAINPVEGPAISSEGGETDSSVRGETGGRLFYDLHVHSCLSPCADEDMTPYNIANMAMLCGLDIVALTDHNSLKNCPAFFAACGEAGVVPVAGVELCTREEVHVVCLFPTLAAGLAFDEYIETILPDIENRPDIFGRQCVLGPGDVFLREEARLLISACDIGIDELPTLTRGYGGIAVPAHIDRKSNSLISNLGFIPAEYEFTCYEVRNPAETGGLIAANPALAGKLIVHDSDAHRLADIPDRGPSLEIRGPRDAASLIKTLLGGGCGGGGGSGSGS